MMRAFLRARFARRVVVPATLAVLGSFAVPTAPVALAIGPGQDIGWPMCPTALGGQGKPMPPDATVAFVVPELNSGLAFVPNQCLADHYQWGRDRAALLGGYLFPNYPDAQMLASAATGRYGTCATLRCRLMNSGYAQAKWDVARLAATGVTLPMIWVDIEHQPRLGGTRMWTNNVANNRLVLSGVFAYLQEHHIRIGVYSYPNGYNQIVGNWSLTYPEWIPTGGHLAAERAARCKQPGFSNGPVWMTQSTRPIKAYDIDDDTICPVAVSAVRLMFSSPVTNAPVVPAVRDHRLTPYATSIIKYGSKGSGVVAAQRALRLRPDGVFGRQTAAAVARLQRAKGQRVNGIVGTSTWLLLGA
jgi:hypothetical protein